MSFPYDKTMNQICNVHFIDDANDVLLGASGVCIFLNTSIFMRKFKNP